MPEDSAATNGKPRNWPLWSGFVLSLFALVSYPSLFARYPVTRDVPWVNFLLFALALVLLFVGLRRAFAPSALYRGKVAGPILAALSVAALAFFCLIVFYFGKNLPAASQAPRVGQKAPDFTLTDANGSTVSLAALLSTSAPAHPSKGVLLIFYRGYW